jgi:hypothetical protein
VDFAVPRTLGSATHSLRPRLALVPTRPAESTPGPRSLRTLPRTQHPPLTWPQPVQPSESQKEGVRPGNPTLGEAARPRIPHPCPSAEAAGRQVARRPHTCLAGPCAAVTAQVYDSLPLGPRRLPRPIPPAAAQQRLLTARARAAREGRGRGPGARRAPLGTPGLNGRGRRCLP